MHAKSLQSCPTLCNSRDCSLKPSLAMEFSRKEYWKGLLCPLPGDLPDPEIEAPSLKSPALPGEFVTINTTWDARKAY